MIVLIFFVAFTSQSGGDSYRLIEKFCHLLRCLFIFVNQFIFFFIVFIEIYVIAPF